MNNITHYKWTKQYSSLTFYYKILDEMFDVMIDITRPTYSQTLRIYDQIPDFSTEVRLNIYIDVITAVDSILFWNKNKISYKPTRRSE